MNDKSRFTMLHNVTSPDGAVQFTHSPLDQPVYRCILLVQGRVEEERASSNATTVMEAYLRFIERIGLFLTQSGLARLKSALADHQKEHG